MTTSALIPIPSNDTQFEDNCEILAKSVLNDPNASTFAEKGYKQFGIDILGYRDQDPDRIVGIQCKLKTKGSAPTETDIRAELKKLEDFEEELESYYVWHTANDSTKLEELAVSLTKELSAAGKRTTVHIWGWRKLSNLISQDPDALREFSPDHTAISDKVLQRLADQSAADEQVVSKLSSVQESVTRLEQHFEASEGALEGEDLGAYHKVIDQYAELLRDGKAETALGLLRDLEKTFDSQTAQRVRFRVRANIGHALIRLGSSAEGCQALKEAVEFDPNTSKSWQTRAIAEASSGNTDKAIQVLKDGLEEFPDDAGLVSLSIQFAADDPEIEDPWSIVPKALSDNADVLFGVVSYQREKADDAWRELAKSSSANHPKSKALALAAAEAKLAEAIEKHDLQREIPDDESLVDAANYLQEVHDSAYESEERAFPNNLIVACNLVTAYRILGKYEAAGSVVDQLLPFLDDHPFIIDSIVPALSALGRYDECRSLLEQMPPGRNQVMLAIETYLAVGDFSGLIDSIDESSLATLSEGDQALARGALLLARDAQDPQNVSLQDVQQLTESAAEIVDSWAVSANLLFRKGQEEQANSSFEQALSLIDEQSSRPDRYNLARVGQQLGRWDDVINLLSGYVFLDAESEELIRLGSAFVEVPKHPDADPYFDVITSSVSTKLVSRLASHHAFNKGDLDRAKAYVDQLLELDPHDAEALVLAASILGRSNREEEIPNLIAGIDLSALTGSVGSRLQLAAILVRHGRPQDGFQLAYDLALENLDDTKITQFFATLSFVMEPELKKVSSELENAVRESWVEFRGPEGDQAILITERPSQLAHDIVNISDDRAKALLGARVGDTIDLPVARKRSQKVEVTGIHYRFPGLLRSILRNFDRRYSSGGDGMYSIQTREGDIQPILEEVKELSEAELETARMYTEGVVPMFVVAPRVRGNVIDFAGYLVGHNLNVTTCLGTLEERNAAVNHIRRFEGKGVVLDTYTFWTACDLDILDPIKAFFGTVYLAQSTIDDLVAYREHHRPKRDEPLMTVGYIDGEYFREEIDAERLHGFIEVISQRIQTAQEECVVVPAHRPAELDSTEFHFLDQEGGQGLDSIYVAISESAHLLSDDMRYRQLGQGVGKSESSWLQVLLLTLNETGSITDQDYVDSIVALAARRHRYVSVRAADLLAVAKSEQTPSDRFRLTAKLIGSTDAEIGSHIRVLFEFGSMIDEEDDLGVTRYAFIGLLLEEIIKHRREDWREILDAIKSLFQRAGRQNVANYIDRWRQGHFLV